MKPELSPSQNPWPLILSGAIFVGTLLLLPGQWHHYREASEHVEQARAVIDTSEQFLSAFKDAETGQRGFLLTHNASYLEPYRHAIEQIPQILETLQKDSLASPGLQPSLIRLESLGRAKLLELDQTITLEKTQGATAALNEVRTNRGQALMMQMRQVIGDIQNRQLNDLAVWSAHSERFGQRTLLFAAGSVALLVGFLLAATISSRRAQERELELLRVERASQEALQESEGRFRVAVDNAPVMIWISDVDKKGIHFNKGWIEFTGRSLQQEMGDGWTEGIHPEDRPSSLEIYRRSFDARQPFKMEYRLRRNGGEYRWVVNQGIPRFLRGGEFVGYIGSCIDIQDQKMLERELEQRVDERTQQLRQKEEELMQSRKIEAIGRLAGGVAHDFNNMLTGIFGIAEEIRDDLEPTHPHRQGVEEILKAGRRAAALTKQLLAFGRRQVAAPVVLNLNHTLNDMSSMLKRLIGEDIQLVPMLKDNLGNVRMDAGQIEQIVINLVLNARDAMPQGGKITIETANVNLDETYARKHFQIVPGPHVLLAISDTGVGMDPRTQEHAFEPFFTTKEGGKGTGMGLATVYGIVKQNNGDIFLYSTPGAGTTFKIYFPRVNDPVVEASAPPASRGGTETILLVEDEDLVRRMASKALHRSGYKVLEAANGKEAMEISASYHEPIHLLLTDVVMPGLNGRQLAELLFAQRPAMKVLYMSGYTENIIVQRGILKPGIAFIEKSFTSPALCSKVREVLDAPIPVTG